MIEDDWQNTLVCLDCRAVPCRCSRLTRILEAAHLSLGEWLLRRHRKRQRELHEEV